MPKLVSLKFGPVTMNWDKADNLLMTRDDRAMHLWLSYSEWCFMLLAIQLHGWPTSPPLDMPNPFSLEVTPWEAEEERQEQQNGGNAT